MKETYFRDLLTNDIKESNIILLGIPYDLGCSCGKGASLAPKTIRELSSFLPPFTADGKSLKNNKIYDYNDVSEYSKIEDKFKEILQYDKFNLILGGDHSISIPTQKVFLEYAKKLNKIPVIIHIDAHPDICDFYDGSKYSHACTNMRAIENGYETICAVYLVKVLENGVFKLAKNEFESKKRMGLKKWRQGPRKDKKKQLAFRGMLR